MLFPLMMLSQETDPRLRRRVIRNGWFKTMLWFNTDTYFYKVPTELPYSRAKNILTSAIASTVLQLEQEAIIHRQSLQHVQAIIHALSLGDRLEMPPEETAGQFVQRLNQRIQEELDERRDQDEGEGKAGSSDAGGTQAGD